jgi:hypothetical protein
VHGDSRPAQHDANTALEIDCSRTIVPILAPVFDSLLERAPLNDRSRDSVSARDVLTTIALICQPVPGETSSFSERMTDIFLEDLLAPRF